MDLEHFDWDEDNIRHMAEHDVSPEEFEQVTLNDPLDLAFQMIGQEQRFLQIGLTFSGRILTIASTMRGGKVRPITAFPSSRKQQQTYLRWRGELS